MEPTWILLAILAAAVLGQANSVAVTTGLLLVIKLLGVDNYVFPVLEKGGLFWGLVLLIAAILIPLARGDITYLDLGRIFTSWIGLAALVLSFLTTHLSGLGLQYLTVEGHGSVMSALILGAVIAAAFLGGVSVGPLITSGLLALIVKIVGRA